MSPNERGKLSVIGLTIENYKVPIGAEFYWTVTESALGTTSRPLGTSRSWDYNKYYDALTNTSQKIENQLKLDFPNDSLLFEPYKNLKDHDKNISFIQVDSSSNIKKKDTRMELVVKYIVNAKDYDEPETYVFINAIMKDAEGNTIYDRVIFTEEWIVTDQFLKHMYKSKLENEFNKAAQLFWENITGS